VLFIDKIAEVLVKNGGKLEEILKLLYKNKGGTKNRISLSWNSFKGKEDFTIKVYNAAIKFGLSPASAKLITAFTAHETGWGKRVMNYNLAGIKAGDGWKKRRYYTSVLSDECVPCRKGLKPSNKCPKGKCIERRPRYFRAYRSFVDGVRGVLQVLSRKRYAKSRALLLSGDPMFFRQLGRDGWYTASPGAYESSSLKRLRTIQKILKSSETSYEFSLSKRADETFQEGVIEFSPDQTDFEEARTEFSQHPITEEVQYDLKGIKREEFIAVLNDTVNKLRSIFKYDKGLRDTAWAEYEEQLGQKITEDEFWSYNTKIISEWVIENWNSIPKPTTASLLSKRANFNEPGTLFFPSQYVEDIRSGKRRYTIRANDVPVNVNEVVRCKTYGGAHPFNLKIIDKSVMNTDRIRKAYGDRTADGLEQRFGDDHKFYIIRFDLANDQKVDDVYNNNDFGNRHGTDPHPLGEGGVIRQSPYQAVAPTEPYSYNAVDDDFLSSRAMKKVLMIVPPVFNDKEYFKAKDAFERNNISVSTASINSSAISENGNIINMSNDLYSNNGYNGIYIVGNDITFLNSIRDIISNSICPIAIMTNEAINDKFSSYKTASREVPFEKDDELITGYNVEPEHLAEILVSEIKDKVSYAMDLKELWKFADELEDDPNLQRIKFENPEEYERLKSEEVSNENDPGDEWLRQQGLDWGDEVLSPEEIVVDEEPVEEKKKEPIVEKKPKRRKIVSPLPEKEETKPDVSVPEEIIEEKKKSVDSFKDLMDPDVKGDSGDTELQKMLSDLKNIEEDEEDEDSSDLFSMLGISDEESKSPEETKEEVPEETKEEVPEENEEEVPEENEEEVIEEKDSLDEYKKTLQEIIVKKDKLKERLDRIAIIRNIIKGRIVYTDKVNYEDAISLFGESGEGKLSLEDSQRADEFSKSIGKEMISGKDKISEEDVRKWHNEIDSELKTQESRLKEIEKKFTSQGNKNIKKKVNEASTLEDVSDFDTVEDAEDFKELTEAEPDSLKLSSNDLKNLKKKIVDGEETPHETMTKILKLQNRKTIYGFSFEPYEDWPSADDIIMPEMSDKAKELFSVENFKDGYATTRVFAKPDTWQILDEEENRDEILKNWIYPSLTINIAKRWLNNNIAGTMARGVFTMLEPNEYDRFKEIREELQIALENIGSKLQREKSKKSPNKKVIAQLEKENNLLQKRLDNHNIRNLPSALTYKKYALTFFADILNTYLSDENKKHQYLLPNYLYKALNNSMTKVIAKERDLIEKRLPECSICRAKAAKGAFSNIMEKDSKSKNTWSCPNCKKYAETAESKLSDLKSNHKRLRMEIAQVDNVINGLNKRLSISEDEEQENRHLQRLYTKKKYKDELLIRNEMLKNEISEVEKDYKLFSNQTGVPTLHLICINENCPGQKIPLNSIDWSEEKRQSFWDTEAGKKALRYFKKEYDIVPPWQGKGSEADDVPDNKRRLPAKAIWDVPFICPHDGSRFTPREAWGKGPMGRGGLIWDPYMRSIWISQPSVIDEGVPGVSDKSEQEADQHLDILYDKYAEYAKSILDIKHRRLTKKFSSVLAEMINSGQDVSKIKYSKKHQSNLRLMALYDEIKDFSEKNRDLFIAWLSKYSYYEKIEKDGMVIKRKKKIKRSTKENRADFYIPLLRSWLDRMLRVKNGFQIYGLNSFLVNEKTDGIPSNGEEGTFFITKVKNGDDFHASCNLKLKLNKDGKPLRKNSSKKPRIMKVLGAWKLNPEEVINIKEKYPRILNGEVAVPEEIKFKILKEKDNKVDEIIDYNYHTLKFNKEDTTLYDGEYLLVQAYIIPGDYRWKPIRMMHEVRSDNDKEKFFEKFGRLVLSSEDNPDPEFWKMVLERTEKISSETSDPSEALKRLEEYLSQGQIKKSNYILSFRDY